MALVNSCAIIISQKIIKNNPVRIFAKSANGTMIVALGKTDYVDNVNTTLSDRSVNI